MACMYVVAQFLGAIVGFGLLKLLTPSAIFSPGGTGTCSPAPNPALSAAQVFFFEYFATTVLITMCCAAWDPRHSKNQDSIPIKFGLATSVPFIAVVSYLIPQLQYGIVNLNVIIVSSHWMLHKPGESICTSNV